jgi:hypothetical protein
MKQQYCKICKSQSFHVYFNNECSTCSNNYVWNDEEDDFIKPTKKDCNHGVSRRVEHDGECAIGSSNGEGCFVIKCEKCNRILEFIPLGYS